MAYLWLGLSIALTVVWALCYKVAAQRDCEMLSVSFWVYVGAAAVMVVHFLITGCQYNASAAKLGFITGIATYLATITFFYHIRTGVLAVSWTVIGLALAFPVIASIIFWNEHPTTRQWTGLALIPVAFILCGMKPQKKEA